MYFTYQLIHVYEKLIRIAIIASLAMFGKPCVFWLCPCFAAVLCFSITFFNVFYTLLASSGSVKIYSFHICGPSILSYK